MNPQRRLAPTALVVSVLSGAAFACGSFAGPPAEDAGTPPDGAPPATDGSVDVSPAPAPDAAAPDACRGAVDCPRYVFVTSDTYVGGDLGGATGADTKCTLVAAGTAAAPALKGRTYMAWISEPGASASNRLSHGTGPYRLSDDTVIANNWDQLVSNALLHAIDRDEQGVAVGSELVWTGTDSRGHDTPFTCGGWTISLTQTGTAGRTTNADLGWTNASFDEGCETRHRLYCFEY